MLTVVQCLPSLDHGGVERGTLEVAAALVQRGHRSMVVAGGGRLVPELTAAGSQHIAQAGSDRFSHLFIQALNFPELGSTRNER